MTVERGQSWGERCARPSDLVEVEDDAAAAVLVDRLRRAGEPIPPIGLRAGDLRRTLGGGGNEGLGPDEVGRFTVDLGVASVEGRPHLFLSHVLARRSWWRGEVVAVMNAEFLGDWDVAPRGHPNDGRLDVVAAGADLRPGDRWKAWRRLPSGTHVPHPGIRTARVAEARFAFDRPLALRLDGRLVGHGRELEVRIEPDALVVCI